MPPYTSKLMADSPPQLSLTEFFKSLLLSFSPNLDEFNPDIPEWRQDVGRVIKKALLQVSDFHFLCPALSLPSIILSLCLRSFPSPFTLYLLPNPATPQLFLTPLLPLLPNTLGSSVRQENALGWFMWFFIRQVWRCLCFPSLLRWPHGLWFLRFKSY